MIHVKTTYQNYIPTGILSRIVRSMHGSRGCSGEHVDKLGGRSGKPCMVMTAAVN